MRTLKQFVLYRRKSKAGKKPTYYVKYKLPDGSWGNAKSTGATNKKEAEQIAIDILAELNKQNEMPLFSSFAADFFNYSKEWAEEIKITGRRISERQCREKQRLLDTHIIPNFKNKKINEITESDIKILRNSLFKKYAGATVNYTLSCINAVLDNARSKKLIESVPKVSRVSQRGQKRKGILTQAEANAVLSKQNWKDERARIMNIVAATAGMRAGELLALQIKDIIRVSNVAVINILRSWDRQDLKHNDTTKTGYSRRVTIPSYVISAIDELIKINPHYAKHGEDAFIFFARDSDDRPMRPEKVKFYFYSALRACGITEAERKERNISFHSWRYYFNSFLLNSRIPMQKVQMMTGHLTDEMTQHYYETTIESLSDVLEVQERMFRECDRLQS